MKKFLFLLLLQLLSLTAVCQTIEFEGLYFVPGDDNTCTLVENPHESYTGDIIIPSKISVGNSIYKVTSIGQSAFDGCSSLTSVTIGDSIEEFGSAIWDNCPNIKNVYYAAKQPIEGQPNMFDDVVYDNANLHIPANAIDKAKTINPWMRFNSIAAYDFSAGIGDVMVDQDPDAKVEVYNLSGVKVFDGPRSEIALPRGYYILIQNGKPSKVLLDY